MQANWEEIQYRVMSLKVKRLDNPDVEYTLPEFVTDYAKATGMSETRAWIEVLEQGASRVGQLYRYKEKRKKPDSKFRAYAPLKLDAEARGNVKRAAKAAGVAPVVDPREGQCTARNAKGTRCLWPVHGEETKHRF